eukprot:SAG22_NODE_676_length_7962_cov_75.623681_4_plen_230_part_00
MAGPAGPGRAGAVRRPHQRQTTMARGLLAAAALLLATQPQPCTSPSWLNLVAQPADAAEHGAGGTPDTRRGHSLWLQEPSGGGGDDAAAQPAAWVFGGWAEGGSRLNDLWRLEPSRGCGGSTIRGDADELPRWTCGRKWQPVAHGHRSPATVTDTVGEYGSLRVAAEKNVPGARDGHAVVMHRHRPGGGRNGTDRMWMFGGTGLVRVATGRTVVLMNPPLNPIEDPYGN